MGSPGNMVMHLVNEAEMEALAKYIAGLTP